MNFGLVAGRIWWPTVGIRLLYTLQVSDYASSSNHMFSERSFHYQIPVKAFVFADLRYFEHSQQWNVTFLSVLVFCFFSASHLTSIFRVHMRRVEAKVDEKGDGHSILEPLHHIGLAIQGIGYVASQDYVVSCTCRHKLGLLSHSVGTWKKSIHKSVRSTIKR